MKKILFILPILIMFVGCKSLSNGLIKPEFTALKAENDMNAVKTGDLMPIKGSLEAKIAPQIGVGNQMSDTRVGGNMTTSNDSKLMTDYINAIKEGNKQLIGVMWKIIYGLLGLISTLAANLFFVVKSLLKSNENDDSFKESLINKGV